jgi:hypothetical protein
VTRALPDTRSYDRVLAGGDAPVLDAAGEPVLVLRRRALAAGTRTLPALRRAAVRSGHRGGLRSGTFGYMERGAGRPCGWLTRLARAQPDLWEPLVRLARELDAVYRETLPASYRQQRRFARLTHPDFLLPGTVFTTLTVNHNAAFAPHRDGGNLTLGHSVMAVRRRGDYGGGLFVLPEVRVAVDLGDGDVVFFKADALHGNTAFTGAGGYERLSVVAYYRLGLLRCGSALEENAKVNRL